MVDIDCYGIPIRLAESQHQPAEQQQQSRHHMSSDSFWGDGNNNSPSDSLTDADSSRKYTRAEEEGKESDRGYQVNGIIYQQSLPLRRNDSSPRKWPTTSASEPALSADNTASNVRWNMSSTVAARRRQQPPEAAALTESSSLLECSASDLRLCLGLQQPSQTSGAASAAPPRRRRSPNATILKPDLGDYGFVSSSRLNELLSESHDAEIADLSRNFSSSLEPVFFAGLQQEQSGDFFGADLLRKQRDTSTVSYGGCGCSTLNVTFFYGFSGRWQMFDVIFLLWRDFSL